MKNQTHRNWLWQGLMATALFVAVGLSTAHAASPFQAGDFVRIPELGGLEVQKNEITYDQWNALNALLPPENRTPWKAQDCSFKEFIAKGFGPKYAAACISFDDAEAYIRVLNPQDPNYTYRLPTDKELRALVDLTLGALRSNGSISDERLSRHAWYYPISNNHAHEVCTTGGTVSGLCDILGNVWEWTSTPEGSDRVLRGGSWDNGASYLRFGFRDGLGPGVRSHLVGFRLVRR